MGADDWGSYTTAAVQEAMDNDSDYQDYLREQLEREADSREAAAEKAAAEKAAAEKVAAEKAAAEKAAAVKAAAEKAAAEKAAAEKAAAEKAAAEKKMRDITVKTMSGEKLTVTVDGSATVLDLAEKIAEKKPGMEPGSMKLTYKKKTRKGHSFKKTLNDHNKLIRHAAMDSMDNISSTGYVVVEAVDRFRVGMGQAGKALLHGALHGQQWKGNAQKAAAEKAAAAPKPPPGYGGDEVIAAPDGSFWVYGDRFDTEAEAQSYRSETEDYIRMYSPR